jgi:hypothetical protein
VLLRCHTVICGFSTIAQMDDLNFFFHGDFIVDVKPKSELRGLRGAINRSDKQNTLKKGPI